MAKGKTYFDLCNEVLSELVYEEVDTFEELDDITEGKKVKRMLNDALLEICNNETKPWKFRQKTIELPIVGGIKRYDLPNGYIRYIRYKDTPMVLNYIVDNKSLPQDTSGMPLNYWINNEHLTLYPTPDNTQTNRILEVAILTYDYAIDCCGLLKPIMDSECDEPIIPNHHRDILKWKVCADWRGNITDARCQYFQSKYKTAYRALLMDQRGSADYPNRLDIMGPRNTAQDSIMQAFYNPYTRRII